MNESINQSVMKDDDDATEIAQVLHIDNEFP